ncbi:MAG: hypothetical protein Q7T60_08315, partial [Sphingopyxis sp.]|nr:hypothetical protein [Sphingopyxis sp.]
FRAPPAMPGQDPVERKSSPATIGSFDYLVERNRSVPENVLLAQSFKQQIDLSRCFDVPNRPLAKRRKVEASIIPVRSNESGLKLSLSAR